MRSKLKRRNTISIVLAILAGAIIAVARTAPVEFLDYGLGLQSVGIVIGAIAVSIGLTIRCPHCGCRLRKGRWGGVPEYCPKCGTAITDERTVE